jgi:guanylate kinase
MPEGNRPARGKLIVISAPSGSGKTSIAKEIMKRNPSLTFSVSATTRAKRAGEVEGKDYFFLTKEEFNRRVAAGEFVEWEEIYGDYYGTLKREVDRALVSGEHIVFDVDVKGGLSIKREYPETLVVFIRPPSIEALRQRLVNRHTEDETTIARRMERVPMEMKMGEQFDHQVVNDELSLAIDEVQTIVKQHLDQ